MKNGCKSLILVAMAWTWISKQWELLNVAYRNWTNQNYSLHMLCKPHSYILIVGRDVLMALCGVIVGMLLMMIITP